MTMMRFTIMLLAVSFLGTVSGQNAVSDEITLLLKNGQTFSKTDVLQFQSNDVQQRDYKLDGLAKGTVLSLKTEMLRELTGGQAEKDFIKIRIPVTDRSEMMLVLKRHEIFTADFALYSSTDRTAPLNYTPGLHYKGIVEGDPSSVVAMSIYNNEVMALISSPQGNAVIGLIKGDRENRHIFYYDQDLDRPSDFECGTMDDGLGYTEDQLKSHPQGRDVGDCVRLYIEIDDDIVTQKGGAAPATDYITGLFNQVIVMYNNETLSMMINEILAWTTPAPYSGGTSSAMLSSYQNNTGAFNGDLSHLVSYQASGGIAAGFNGICNSNPDLSKCFSSIDGVYNTVPTYSWDVMVTTHEMGHLIGSRHTHACVWNGNNTAIDGCSGSVEGNCPLPGIPAGGGTIMSYCHLQNVGINFSLGFGPQPGNVIRNTVNATGNCLTPCGPPPPPPPPAYCSSNGSNTSDEWINNVTLGSINNTSGNNGGYANYTSLSTNLTAGSAYTINLTPGFSGQTYLEYWRVWIDYNGDLDWADAGEQVGQGSGTAAINVNFTVPAGSSAITTRMRVSMQYNAYPPICGTFTWGEVEDYTVNIVAATGPTCSDGIQNQGETGVDCGGPCPACTGETVLLASYFESGWDSWTDGGSDVARVNSANSWEGIYSIRLADNSGTQSAMTSPAFNLSDATGAEIEFHFYASSMEVGEDFWVRYNNGSGWTTIATYIRGTNFNNSTFYVTTVTVPNFNPTTAGSFRIQCDASDNSDQIYVDQVIITKITGSNLIEPGIRIQEVSGPIVSPVGLNLNQKTDTGEELFVYPNPVNDVLNISFNGNIENIRMMSLDGKEIKVAETAVAQKQIDIYALAPGIYFLWVQSAGEWYPTRFSKM
jgi:Metallo-peptidase family M12/GEVED domain/Secretion system C-terminal sorting domain